MFMTTMEIEALKQKEGPGGSLELSLKVSPMSSFSMMYSCLHLPESKRSNISYLFFLNSELYGSSLRIVVLCIFIGYVLEYK